jgi:hypothetical protein
MLLGNKRSQERDLARQLRPMAARELPRDRDKPAVVCTHGTRPPARCPGQDRGARRPTRAAVPPVVVEVGSPRWYSLRETIAWEIVRNR